MTTATLTEKTVTIKGKTIFYAETGSGPAVLLLHGGGPGASGVSNFSRNIDALAKDFRVHRARPPRLRPLRQSCRPERPLRLPRRRNIRGLLDDLGIAKAHLVGNSYGGACALRLALDTPDRVNRMVLMGPGGIGTTRALPTSGLQHLLAYYGGDGPSREKLKTLIREDLVFAGDAVPNAVIDTRYQSSIDPEVIANPPLRRPSGLFALRTLWRMDFTRDPRLARLQTPTLVIWGAADQVNRPSGGKMLADTMPNCDLLVTANAGHWVQWERADFFNQVTHTYLTI
jgi:4,5:9,10-diseco-3-hydroxy-5,9,17-trioxoandrosta-1(10),2-diene-4-oate hydrolase